jgi:hypothetical protein
MRAKFLGSLLAASGVVGVALFCSAPASANIQDSWYLCHNVAYNEMNLGVCAGIVPQWQGGSPSTQPAPNQPMPLPHAMAQL